MGYHYVISKNVAAVSETEQLRLLNNTVIQFS